uniref:Uncharacterized protein n=1 Tax=Utricularia reniformis TaxID=192314 RepID=A0A1Y0B389_9LAMI|nr:hypothetical protein AEK19_MT1726 [Utricularia reniformis]ART31905.1 hypothetical protein AEK19_MT1726 [Utricularia reniformis]
MNPHSKEAGLDERESISMLLKLLVVSRKSPSFLHEYE